MKSAQHGGRRSGSGRKACSGRFRESTKPIRVPLSLFPIIQDSLKAYNLKLGNDLASIATTGAKLSGRDLPAYSLPLYSHLISAGFPSPADDHIERKLDLNSYLIPHPATTFFIRVVGDSMIDAHIVEGDILVVDRSLTPKHNDIVIAVVDSELTVKRLIRKNDLLALKPENAAYPIIAIADPDRLFIWGVVTSVIHNTREHK